MKFFVAFVFLVNSLFCYGDAISPIGQRDVSIFDESIDEDVELFPIQQSFQRSTLDAATVDIRVQQQENSINDAFEQNEESSNISPARKEKSKSTSTETKSEAKLEKKLEKLNIFSRLDDNNRRVLTYYGLMLAGAVARSASATAVHPLNVVKTMLQTKDGKMPELSWRVLSRGAGSQFIMSVPHGAINFAVTE
eukprot:gene12915-27243_t